MLQKAILGSLLVLCLWSDAAWTSAQDLEEHKPLKSFPFMGLDLYHITSPFLEEMTPGHRLPPRQEHEHIFQTLLYFMAEVIFLNKEEGLYKEKTLYPRVQWKVCEHRILNTTHTPYQVCVEPWDVLSGYQEYYRQKNVAFMVDLWWAALGEKKQLSQSAPRTLRRLMQLLGSNEVEVPAHWQAWTFLEHVSAVTTAHKAYKKGADASTRLALCQAARGLHEWSHRYEKGAYTQPAWPP